MRSTRCLFLLIFISAFLSGCLASGEKTNETGIPINIVIGPTLPAGSFALTVHSFSRSTQHEYTNCKTISTSDPDKEYAVVNFSVQNNFKESKEIYYNQDVKVEDLQGNKFDAVEEQLCDWPWFRNIQPTGKLTIVGVFEVPKSTGLKHLLVYEQSGEYARAELPNASSQASGLVTDGGMARAQVA